MMYVQLPRSKVNVKKTLVSVDNPVSCGEDRVRSMSVRPSVRNTL